MSAETRSEFLDSWQQHDRASERFSDKRGRDATTATLKQVTDRLVTARTTYCAALGISPVHAQSILEGWRRAGFNHQRALRALEAGWKERDEGTAPRP